MKNEENCIIQKVYASNDIISIIEFRRLQWAGPVHRMSIKGRGVDSVFLGRTKGKRIIGNRL